MDTSRDYHLPYLLDQRKSALILGPRGSGKSFYLNKIVLTRRYLKIDLLESDSYKLYLNRPSHIYTEVERQLSLSPEPLVLFIDEVQLVPSLLNEAHRMIENFKEKLSVVLTGSSARKLKKVNANLLAGRAFLIPFYPFMHTEIDFDANFNKIMQYGTLPQVFHESLDDMRCQFLKTYTTTYLREEILQESLVRNIEGFSLFLDLAAQDNGSPVNYSKIGKQVGLSGQAIKEYFQILLDTLIAIRIPAWTTSIRKQLLSSSKYYFFDNGVLNSLNGEIRSELKESSFRYGRLFENLVINEIDRYNKLKNFDYKLYHYRTNHGQEVDLIVQKNPRTVPIAIEIKSAILPEMNSLSGLKHFSEDFPDCRKIVLCRCKNPYQAENIEFLPFVEGIREIFS